MPYVHLFYLFEVADHITYVSYGDYIAQDISVHLPQQSALQYYECELCVWVSYGRHNKVLQTGWLNQLDFIVSQFWRLDLKGPGVVPPEAVKGNLSALPQLPVVRGQSWVCLGFWTYHPPVCLYLQWFFSELVSGCILLLIGHQSFGIRDHPNDPILSWLHL